MSLANRRVVDERLYQRALTAILTSVFVQA